MAGRFPGLIRRLQEFEPGVLGRISAEWASDRADHRRLIRESLRRDLGLTSAEHDRLSDLKLRPSVSGWSISISHCPLAGGWLARKSQDGLGFDLEDSTRIREPLVNRIAGPGELGGCPDPRRLWVAKEAYFKALAPDHPRTVTELYIDSWAPGADGGISFAGRGGTRPGRGLTVSDGDLLVSICII